LCRWTVACGIVDDVSDVTPPRGLRAGLVLAGRYQIGEAIGAGGMGTVYRGTHLELGRDVAIKLIGNGRTATPEQVARFEREARLLARLSHPSIVTVFDFGRTDDGTLFLVLELVRGESLEARLRRGRLPWAEAVDVGVQVAHALAAAHAEGVLHRDLKPSNVMLSSATATRVKLIDFGLARLAHFGDTPVTASSSAVMGTPGYIAPEYAWTGQVSAQMDHYALGLVLFEMLAAQHPFVAVDARADRLAVARKRLVDAAADAPTALVDVVMALLSPDPADRPASPAAELASLSSSSRGDGAAVVVARGAVALVDSAVSASAAFSTSPQTPSSAKRRAQAAGPPPPGALARPMVDVDGGLVQLVIDRRVHEVRLRPYAIDKHPVTHGDWYAFVQAGGAAPPSSWVQGRPARADLSCPVTHVAFEDAAAYAKWIGRRLPTEAEWLLAAGGGNGNSYPWGDQWQTGLCHATWSEPFEQRRPGPIGMYSPSGDSPFGVSDLLEVWEWVTAPYQTRGAVVRGGAWRDRSVPPQLHNRSWEDEPSRDVGFRCAR
jgi:formylglycine-generating enzyme required for sulfatase activity